MGSFVRTIFVLIWIPEDCTLLGNTGWGAQLHVMFVLSQTLCLGINFSTDMELQFEHVYIILLFAIGTEHVF
jgi:hypothetical protein